MILIGNGRLITRDENNTYLEDGCVAVEGERIVGVGDTSNLRDLFPDAEYIDAKRAVIMPGLINVHNHIYSTFARGMSLTGYQPQNFDDILEGFWWRMDRALSLDNCYQSARYSYMDCIKNGVTTIFDHHASYGAIDGSLEQLAIAATEFGVRTSLCFEASDRGGEENALRAIEENANFLRSIDTRHDMLQAMMGLHASFTLSEQTLELARSAVSMCTDHGILTGFHIHVAEGSTDVQDCLHRYNKRVVQRLFDAGILGSHTIAAHCIHINEEEMMLLRDTNTNVVVNPESNMGNAVGCPNVLQMMHEYQIPIGLGTDGYTNDMLESLKVGNLIHKHVQQNPNVAWTEIPEMLFANNHRIANKFFSSTLGKIEEGAAADLIVVDYQGPTPMTAENVNSHILFGMNGAMVRDTMIAGVMRMRNRILVDVEEEEVAYNARESARKLWNVI